jgi:hypothetical protein
MRSLWIKKKHFEIGYARVVGFALYHQLGGFQVLDIFPLHEEVVQDI